MKNNNNAELRFMPFAPVLEKRQEPEGREVIAGYALKYNVLSQTMWGMREKIDPGALDGCDMSDVLCTLNHNFDKLLGRNTSGTLTLKADDVGLYYEVEPPATGAGPETLELIARRDITGSSFMFWVREDKWENIDTEDEIRTILKIEKIFELGPVVNPAYLQTEADVVMRSRQAAIQKIIKDQNIAQPSLAVKHAHRRLELIKAKCK